MKKWLEDLAVFYRNKAYVLLLSLTAAGSYGYLITHSTVGIDDTPYSYYFEEGLAAIVGRWVLFLVNKVFHIAEYAPFLTDAAGVLLLMAAVTVWSVLFYRILGKRVPWYGYLFFAGIFLSCPLLSEVYTYHLHNGVSIGYLGCGISLCCFLEGLEKPWKERLKPFACSAVFLWISLGCYESFMIVWLLGVFLVLLTRRLAAGKYRKTDPVFFSLLQAALLAVCGIVLRSVMILAVTRLFGLQGLRDEAVQRSITEMAAWMLEPGAHAEFGMALKRIFVMYGVFGYAYYPIKIFLMASVMILLFCLWRSCRQRDPWILLLTLGSFAVSFLLVFIEGKATLYRSAQFLPVICGYGALLFVYGVSGLAKKAEEKKPGHAGGKAAGRGLGKAAAVLKGVSIFLLAAILWNQCADMNHWFYVDYKKYQEARDLAGRIYHALEADFDISKPVMFTGTYEVPKALVQDAYVEYNSETFYRMNRLAAVVDEHLLEKFYRPYGVWVAQTPSLSVIDWGRYAFDDDSELVRFFHMEGYELQPLLDNTLYPEAEEFSLDLPHFPAEGSIVDRGDYIIVHF